MKRENDKTVTFRFQNLTIWQMSIDISDQLFDLADKIESAKHFRFAEQLRAATLSISNNIAEGSGSTSKKDFAHFLNISRRSVFEVANILIISNKRNYLNSNLLESLLTDLDHLSRKITNFRKTLISQHSALSS